MSAMRAVTSHPPAQLTTPQREKARNSNGLGAILASAGVDVASLFGWKRVVYCPVESVSALGVTVELGGRQVVLPRALVAQARADQWLRFERSGEVVRVQVDLFATLKGEARLADLFQQLVPHAR